MSGDGVGISTFVCSVAAATVGKGDIFMQSVILVGALIDATMSTAFFASREPQVSEKAQRSPMKDMGWDSDSGCRQNLLKYWLAGRKTFEDGSMPSLSADDSRVGGRTRMIIAAALPTNEAMYLPPQALLARSQAPICNPTAACPGDPCGRSYGPVFGCGFS